jgi:hypothetical protein
MSGKEKGERSEREGGDWRNYGKWEGERRSGLGSGKGRY